jgi:hypothetical protein
VEGRTTSFLISENTIAPQKRPIGKIFDARTLWLSKDLRCQDGALGKNRRLTHLEIFTKVLNDVSIKMVVSFTGRMPIRVSLKGVSVVQRFTTRFLAIASLAACFSVPSASACDNCIAQQQASSGHMRHVGGSMGTGRYEGVGFSSISADDAIRRCCYWGQRTPTGIGVVRGANGWYATVLYR